MPQPLAPKAQLAYDVLKNIRPGGQITREELNDRLPYSCDPHTEGVKWIAKARKRLATEQRLYFRWGSFYQKDLGVLYCMDSHQILDKSEAKGKHVYRESKKIQQMTTAINEGELSQEEKARYRTTQVQAVMTERMNSHQATTKLLANGKHLQAPELDKLLGLMSQ